ncbi:pentatricopeptide repeat-containing protein At1g32415, mitochondrial-like [Selaginella moellendorffii]|uniref:pentatricopeptide repeat-containing protein At1g32415, mitochondrial-like n=1 Tax=Selaginella moellendorffii TaxID=88036 RepID=UPI000D1C33D9|nr:pentatricopeptide repeat-containing protein At1g32415, mitochondrial-like [Selaginella moellendorffii]|eukprot:XP_024515320.1 pentatricopeptide repeat-containing protein At1g32415, mitochondrial-like [Selaginella moellendorffii]
MPQRDSVSQTAMVADYAQCGHLELATRLLQEMPRHNLLCWNAILLATAAENGLLDEAKQTFGLMPQHNSTSSTAMLASYAQHKQLRESKVFFDDMLERDVVSWTAMLAAYAHNGHVRHSERLFESLPERDTICWSAMLAALVQNGLYLEAFVVFDEIKMAGSIDKIRFSGGACLEQAEVTMMLNMELRLLGK